MLKTLSLKRCKRSSVSGSFSKIIQAGQCFVFVLVVVAVAGMDDVVVFIVVGLEVVDVDAGIVVVTAGTVVVDDVVLLSVIVVVVEVSLVVVVVVGADGSYS